MTKKTGAGPDCRARFITTTAPLIGQTLQAVAYHDSVNDDGSAKLLFNPEDPYHSLSQGVDLISTNHRIGFAWAGQIHLEAFPDGLGNFLRGVPPIDITDHHRWQDRIGREIATIELDKEYSCDAIIRFHNAPPIWLAARYDQPPLPLDPCGDDLIVAFDEPTAHKLGLSFTHH